MLTLSTLLIILHCLTTSNAINRWRQFGGCASAFLRKEEDWVCVGRRNIERKPEWKLNFPEAEQWKNVTKWEKSYKKKVLIRQRWALQAMMNPYFLRKNTMSYLKEKNMENLHLLWAASAIWSFCKCFPEGRISGKLVLKCIQIWWKLVCTCLFFWLQRTSVLWLRLCL